MVRPAALAFLTLAFLLLGLAQPLTTATALPQQPPNVTTIAVLPPQCGGYPDAVYDGYVYFANYCSYKMQRVPLTGGTIQNVSSWLEGPPGSQMFIDGITASQSWVFWTQQVFYENGTGGPGWLVRAPLWGGAPQTMAEIGGGGVPSGVTVSGNYLYFEDEGQDSLIAMTLYGTDWHPVAQNLNSSVWQIAISQGRIYWYDFGTGGIYSISPLGVGFKELSIRPEGLWSGTAVTGVRDIFVANGSVFWSDNTNYTSSLRSVPINGGPTTTLFEGDIGVMGTVADAGPNVAFVAAGGSNYSQWGIFLVPKTGGPATPFVNNLYVQDMSVVGNNVYFTAFNSTQEVIDVAALPSAAS